MAYGPPPAAPPPAAGPDGRPGRSWKNRIILYVGAVVVLVLLYLILAAVIPRWWAHRIGNIVDESITAGVLVGLVVGALFTFLPLLVARLAFLRHMKWKTRLAVLAGALVLAVPNLMTLAVVFGTGNASHAGERTLDTEAPAFRGASLVGAVLAALAALGMMWLVGSRDRRGRELRQLKAERRAHEGSDS